MNRQLRALAIALLACYVALFARLNWTQVVRADELNDRPENGRAIARDFNRPRGDIVTADGVVVAHSVEATEGSFKYQRTYPTKDLFAHAVGSYSLLFGSDGVERTYHDELSGNTARLRVSGFLDPFGERANVGDVTLTMRADVQEAARAALGARPGSVVALDPRTGGVIAMWSYPTYDPNFTSLNNTTAARLFRESLDANPDKPLLARAYRDRFFPGSTFKVVTAAAGLESGRVTEESPSYPTATSYLPPLTNRPIRNFDGASCGGTLLELLRVSCNSAFAQMGAATLGPDVMVEGAQRFGFGEVPPIDLPRAVSSVFPTDYGRRLRAGDAPGDADVYERTPDLAQASIGQNDVSATPLLMAMVAGAIGNEGEMMAPHVLADIRDRDGRVVREPDVEVWQRSTSAASAEILRRAMVGVVERGTASRMAIAGVEVGAKTGTAQLGTDPPRSHAWVIGFAGQPGQPASVAVAVLVQGQPGASEQTGGRVAAPIAKAVMEAALRPLPTTDPGGDQGGGGR